MYRNNPAKAAIIDFGFFVADLTGFNTIDDYIARRAEGHNSPGTVAHETAGLIVYGPGSMKRTPGKNISRPGFRLHHLSSNKHLSRYTPQFENITKKYGLDLNGDWNKIMVADKYHYSKHPDAYHELSLRSMREADAIAKGNRAVFLMTYHSKMIAPLMQNPNILNKFGK